MNHKRGRPKHRRAGCLLCKPSKLNAHKTADRMRAERAWRRYETAAGSAVAPTHVPPW